MVEGADYIAEVFLLFAVPSLPEMLNVEFADAYSVYIQVCETYFCFFCEFLKKNFLISKPMSPISLYMKKCFVGFNKQNVLTFTHGGNNKKTQKINIQDSCKYRTNNF